MQKTTGNNRLNHHLVSNASRLPPGANVARALTPPPKPDGEGALVVRTGCAAVNAGFWPVVTFGFTETAVVLWGADVIFLVVDDVEVVVVVVVVVAVVVVVSKSVPVSTDTDESKNDESLQSHATAVIKSLNKTHFLHVRPS